MCSFTLNLTLFRPGHFGGSHFWKLWKAGVEVDCQTGAVSRCSLALLQLCASASVHLTTRERRQMNYSVLIKPEYVPDLRTTIMCSDHLASSHRRSADIYYSTRIISQMLACGVAKVHCRPTISTVLCTCSTRHVYRVPDWTGHESERSGRCGLLGALRLSDYLIKLAGWQACPVGNKPPESKTNRPGNCI